MASGYPNFGSKLSYVDYIVAHEFVDDIASATRDSGRRLSMDISRQTRDVIASNEALAAENIRVMESSLREGFSGVTSAMSEGFSEVSYAMADGFDNLSTNMNQGFDRISYEMQGVSSGISELNATFHWGFSHLLTSMGRMNDSFEELIQIAKSPAQTAAYEHFNFARDAFRQGLYLESLEFLDKAINGDQTSSGYKIDWRFHLMKGSIRLGSIISDKSLVDLAAAEESFALAARYARTDYSADAAQAFLSAGWAAYCQGKMQEALSHTEQAIAINPKLGEALFQAAKIRMAIGEVNLALPVLAKAIDLDRFFALKAAGDEDFRRHDDKLRDFLEAMRKEKARQIFKGYEDLWHWQKHSPQAASNEVIKRLNAFILSVETMPLFDILSGATILRKTLDDFKSQINKSVSTTINIVERPSRSWTEVIQTPQEETYQDEEIQPIEEIFQEEVVIKPGGFFRKPVTELQTRKRTVTKTVLVSKTRTIYREHSNPVSRELDSIAVNISNCFNNVIFSIEWCLTSTLIIPIPKLLRK